MPARIMTVKIKKDELAEEEVFTCVHSITFTPRADPFTEIFVQMHRRISGKSRIDLIDYYPYSIKISVSESE